MDFNTHNKRVVYGHVEYTNQRLGREIQYKHACFFFFLRVPRSAHSKRDILTFTHQHINPE